MAGTPGGQGRYSPRIRQKREQVRQEILQAAQGILIERGIDSLTLASVAGELHMTRQALYHYFSSKEALVRTLIAALLDDEVNVLIDAVEQADALDKILGILVRAFYRHYIDQLNVFRIVYCQLQLGLGPSLAMDKAAVEREINPRTQHLFDILEARLSGRSIGKKKRKQMRQLAFAAWSSALGLLTMLSIADAVRDPLVHSDEDLLTTLSNVFDNALV